MSKVIHAILLVALFFSWLPAPTLAADCVGTLYPTTVKRSTIEAVTIGQQVDILDGAGPSDYGWLTWSPNEDDENYLIFEITNPKEALQDYVDPSKGSDTILNVGDYVTTLNATVNSSDLRTEFEGLVGQELLVPIWNDLSVDGFKVFNNPTSPPGPPKVNAYLIHGFARVRIESEDDIQIAPDKNIIATYLGPGPSAIHCPALAITKSGPAAAALGT